MKTTNLSKKELAYLRRGLKESWGARIRLARELETEPQYIDQILRGERPKGMNDQIIERIIQEVETIIERKTELKKRVTKIQSHYEELDKKVS
jgi:hypothetical protein